MSEAKEPNKQVMDVSHPGKTAPPLTSKPVIVTNRTILKDPMVVDTTETDDKKAEEAPKNTVAKAPVASDIETSEPKEKEVVAKPEHVVQPIAAPEAEEKPAEEPKKDEPKPESAKPAEPTPTTQNSEDDADNGAVITDAQIEAEAAAEVARDAQVQKLIDSKKYYVPVNAVEKRRTKRVIALGIILSIILALAWVDIALDAGLIDLGSVQPVTHFFSN